MSPTSQVPALVTDVVGVIRSLGDVGVPSIIASEYRESPSFWSRYCADRIVVPNMLEKEKEAFEILLAYGNTRRDRPVMLTGRESDLLVVSRFREELAPYYRMGIIRHNVVCCAVLEQQLLAFPKSKNDDVMDALAYIIKMRELGERYFCSEFDQSPSNESEQESFISEEKELALMSASDEEPVFFEAEDFLQVGEDRDYFSDNPLMVWG